VHSSLFLHQFKEILSGPWLHNVKAKYRHEYINKFCNICKDKHAFANLAALIFDVSGSWRVTGHYLDWCKIIFLVLAAYAKLPRRIIQQRDMDSAAWSSPAAKCLLAAITLALVRSSLAQHPPSLNPPPNIVETVGTVKVPYGRSVYINPATDLHINVAKDDHCFVTVLPDVLSQQPGFLFPERFPCNFGPEDVKYSHLGARSPSEDSLRLQVRYDTNQETYIIPVRLSVEVLFIQRTVITKSLFITVPELMGTSESIDENILGFTYDENTEQCQVATLSGSAGLPGYGHLVGDPSRGSALACDEFLGAGVVYKHTASTDSPNRDHIPMVVEILDEDGNLVKQEYFQVKLGYDLKLLN